MEQMLKVHIKVPERFILKVKPRIGLDKKAV